MYVYVYMFMYIHIHIHMYVFIHIPSAFVNQLWKVSEKATTYYLKKHNNTRPLDPIVEARIRQKFL